MDHLGHLARTKLSKDDSIKIKNIKSVSAKNNTLIINADKLYQWDGISPENVHITACFIRSLINSNSVFYNL